LPFLVYWWYNTTKFDKEMVINMLYGTVKTVDEAGRIVLPKEYRNKMNISAGTKVVLYENDGKLTIEVVTPKCKLCSTAENVNEELSLCEECIKKVKEY
jgi:transcriptional pleiotropic regulator of transition state genes